VTSQTSPTPGRYGPESRRPRPGLVAALVVLAAAFVGWVVWAALAASAPAATGQVTGFRVRGPHALVVEVTMGGDRGPVSCTVQALDATRDVVGVTTARGRIGSSGRVETSVTVRTRARAVAAVVNGCASGAK
jgi:hypothetical protein